jgi:thiosulfate/3-mercaptopyruvate sulfurtransferase
MKLPGRLVTTDWLADHLDDPDLVLLEVDEQPLVYRRGHIQGAHAVDWRTELRDPVTRDLPTPEAMRELFARIGLTSSSAFVVLYGDKNNWHAAFGYWLLRLYGIENLALLDGGRQLWLTQQRPMVTEIPDAAPADEPTTPAASAELRASWWDVLEAARAGHTLVDVRTPAEYQGQIATEPGYLEERAQRAGHIPTAVNVPWDEATDPDGRFRPLEQLRARYGEAGVSADQPTIAYCRIGERSAHTWFVLHELLGHPDVRNYDGSWTEWGSMIGMPIAIGHAPGTLSEPSPTGLPSATARS